MSAMVDTEGLKSSREELGKLNALFGRGVASII